MFRCGPFVVSLFILQLLECIFAGSRFSVILQPLYIFTLFCRKFLLVGLVCTLVGFSFIIVCSLLSSLAPLAWVPSLASIDARFSLSRGSLLLSLSVFILLLVPLFDYYLSISFDCTTVQFVCLRHSSQHSG